MAKILIVDDQPMILKCLESALSTDGHNVATVTAGDLALRLAGFANFDIIITDYAMPRMDGLQFLEICQERSPGVPVIVITGYGTADTAIAAMQKGAFDYLPKPFSLDALRATVNAADSYNKARKNTETLLHPDPAALPYPNIVAASQVMGELCKKVEALAKTNDPVMFAGEPGTGKEVLARTTHVRGPRKSQPFESIDCAQWAAGTTIGGLVGMAPMGTIFFREIGFMPADRQLELVNILKTNSFQAAEGQRATPLTTRILASTSTPLDQLVMKGSVNKDLARLFQDRTLRVPPLRGRPEDVRVHIGLILRSVKSQPGDIVPMEADTLLVLEKYPWPGNLPELDEVIRNAVSMANGSAVGLIHLPRDVVSRVRLSADGSLQRTDLRQFRGRVVKTFLQDMEKEYKDVLSKIRYFTE
ncbi:MAG: response regulator [Verrucomicrobiota bacterium]